MTSIEQQISDTLISAIKDCNLVQFMYRGSIRKVEPFLIGELFSIHQTHLEEGTFALRAWHVSGYSSQPADKIPGDRWRIYQLKEMADLLILNETYKKIRPFYNPDDNAFKRITFRVVVKRNACL